MSGPAVFDDRASPRRASTIGAYGRCWSPSCTAATDEHRAAATGHAPHQFVEKSRLAAAGLAGQ